MKLCRGDLILVDWLDIAEDVTGDPRAAAVAKRKSVGLFWGWRNQHGRRVLVTTTTEDHEDHQAVSGYCAYPWGCVLAVRIVEKNGRGAK